MADRRDRPGDRGPPSPGCTSGTHLPLDLIGGAALGVTVASAVNLLDGVLIHAPAENIRAGPITDV